MLLWQAALLISVLPVTIWLFRFFLVGGGAYFFMNSFMRRMGLAICLLVLIPGFFSAGWAIKGLLNYTRLEETGVRIVQFLQPDKFQRWNDLVSVSRLDWGKDDLPYQRHCSYTLHFKEDGRWSVDMDLGSAGFSADDFQRLTEWLEAHFRFVPSPFLPRH